LEEAAKASAEAAEDGWGDTAGAGAAEAFVTLATSLEEAAKASAEAAEDGWGDTAGAGAAEAFVTLATSLEILTAGLGVGEGVRGRGHSACKPKAGTLVGDAIEVDFTDRFLLTAAVCTRLASAGTIVETLERTPRAAGCSRSL
jgi:hypothetical protein